jgi:hypothetical protein
MQWGIQLTISALVRWFHRAVDPEGSRIDGPQMGRGRPRDGRTVSVEAAVSGGVPAVSSRTYSPSDENVAVVVKQRDPRTSPGRGRNACSKWPASHRPA